MLTDQKKLQLLLKDCAYGFYQQMYFLGKDVIHSRGNQLLSYGFVKSPSKGLKGTSCYTLNSPTSTIELYGSCAGVYTNTTKAVFLRNKCRFYQWLPNEKLIAGLWSQTDLQTTHPEATLESLTPLLEWWIAYEEWIQQRTNKNYRDACFANWKKIKRKTTWLPPQSAVKWVKEFLEKKDQHIRPKSFH